MSRGTRALLVLATAAATVVAGFDAVGWWRVASAGHPVAGAAGGLLSGDPLSGLPGVVQWSRNLVVLHPAGVHAAGYAAALDRLARRQQRWIWTHPAGFLSSARAALLGDDPVTALARLDRALERDPTSAGLHRFAAVVMRDLGRYQECLGHLAEAMAIAPSLAAPRVEVTAEDEQWLALEALRRRLELYPRQRVGVTIELARALRERGQTDLARAQLDGLDRHPEVALQLARWSLEDGAPAAAVAALEEIVSQPAYPGSLRARGWGLLAEARLELGDPDAAAAAAEQALRLAPSSPAPHLALAALAERQGDLEGALQHLRRAWGVAPADVDLLLRVAAVAERAGRPADARLALERAVEVRPEAPELAALLVELHLRNGEYMEAALRLSRALDRFPTDQRLLGLAQRLRREMGRAGG